MVFEGFKLMLAGMFVVYIFLSALLAMIKISEYFFGGESAEAAAKRPAPGTDGRKVAAVISAAISARMSRGG